ncbi:MAG: rhamnulokinase [Promethearchaeota archaeon]|nr:MAG: rhamnulokinase [Candidatus Lokiarchaeota archaeon]
MEEAEYLAFDFGASSARAIAGKLGKKLELREIYRFQTGGREILGSLYWDVLKFYDEVKKALKIQAQHNSPKSIGFDSWGVDFVLLDKSGNLVCNPYHYRDKRTDGIMDLAFEKVPRGRIFNITGLQFMQINSLFQLYSMKVGNSPQLEVTDKLLMIADYFNYLFTKKILCEYTNASTTQLLDLKTRKWSDELINKFDFEPTIFPEIIQPASNIGNVVDSVADETGIGRKVMVIAPATHDTASAIASIPTTEKNFIYISSGTWALMGTELSAPNTSEKALKFNFTNEGGIFGTIRFLKNIIGFWLLQECKRIWENQYCEELRYSALTKEAMDEDIKPFSYLIYPDHPSFLNPPDMTEAIKNYCTNTGQEAPKKRGEICRCILESLAFRYREVFDYLIDIFGNKYKNLYIVGGGAQNSVLSQFTANICDLNVKAGPVEATAIGNLLLQAYGLGEIDSLKDLRNIVKSSVEIREYKPENKSLWEEGFNKYQNLIENFRY